MKRILPALIAALALGLGSLTALSVPGCSSVGLAPAQSVDEKLAYAYGVQTGALKAIATVARSGSISQIEGRSLLAMADNARQVLDSAKTVNDAGDINGASQRLQLATAVLEQLQNYLSKRGASQ